MIKFDLLDKKRILITIILMGILSISLYSFIIYPAIRPQSFRNVYDFTLSIRRNGQISNITNATFLLPLPVQNRRPKIGTTFQTDEMFRREGYTVSLIPGESGVYVKLIVPFMTGTNKDVYRASYGYIDFPDSDSTFRPINTRHPIGNEPVFLPKNNLTSQKPVSNSYFTWYGIGYNPVITYYQIPVYAEYFAPDDTVVEIFASINEKNFWAEFTSYFSNSYRDSYHLFLYGSCDGWYMADGRMETGEGKYLDT